GMADHPADIGCRPIDLSRLHVVDVPHRPVHRHHVAAARANDALGIAGRARRVENVKRLGTADRDAIGWLGALLERLPFDIPALDQIAALLLALEDDAEIYLVRRHLDGAIEQ